MQIPRMIGWTSPRLGVRFDLQGFDLVLTAPDGRRFLSFLELDEEHRLSIIERRNLQEALETAESERDAARARAARLEVRLRELGGDPDRL